MIKSCFPLLASLKFVTFATTLTVGDVAARVVLPHMKVFAEKKKKKKGVIVTCLAAICANQGNECRVTYNNYCNLIFQVFCLLLFLLLNYRNSGHLSKFRAGHLIFGPDQNFSDVPYGNSILYLKNNILKKIDADGLLNKFALPKSRKIPLKGI